MVSKQTIQNRSVKMEQFVFFDTAVQPEVWDSVKRGDVQSLAHHLYRIPGATTVRGGLWQFFLSRFIILNENPYSLYWERRSGEREMNGNMEQVAQIDFFMLYKLFFEGPFCEGEDQSLMVPEPDLDADARILRAICAANEMSSGADSRAAAEMGTEMESDMKAEKGADLEAGVNTKTQCSRADAIVSRLRAELARCPDALQFQDVCRRFYIEYGAGAFALHRAFAPDETDGTLCPVTDLQDVSLDDLVGYDRAKKKLADNTAAFTRNDSANNCLLFGDAGTGKSTAVRAMLHAYAKHGLRMIEVHKHQFHMLPLWIHRLKDRRYRFIIFMDDLSFEEFEVEYKYLKAVIEGGVSKKPDNILIYATSNRRHLIKENFSDKAALADELHGNDTVQEKMSLVARFGLQIYFGAPEKKEYEEIVRALAKRRCLDMDETQLLAAANRFSVQHGGRSGRGATQLIDHLLSSQDI